MWVRLRTYLLGVSLKSSTHGGIGRRSGLKILCPLGTSEFDPRWVYMVSEVPAYQNTRLLTSVGNSSFKIYYMQKDICPLSRRFLRVMSISEKGKFAWIRLVLAPIC